MNTKLFLGGVKLFLHHCIAYMLPHINANMMFAVIAFLDRIT